MKTSEMKSLILMNEEMWFVFVVVEVPVVVVVEMEIL